MAYEILDRRDIDQTYNSKSENPQSGKAVAQALSSVPKGYELIETITIEEEAVVERKYPSFYSKIIIYCQNSNYVIPRIILFQYNGGYRDVLEMNYDAYVNVVSIFGDSTVPYCPNAYAFTQQGYFEGNTSIYYPNNLLGTCVLYGGVQNFAGFRTADVCKAGTEIRVYGVKQ